jgi:6-phosphogluconolactonase (cycloisomerase 2 family)
VYRVVEDAQTGDVTVEPLPPAVNRLVPLKPTGVTFAPNGTFVAVCYAVTAGSRSRHQGSLEVYRFTPEKGIAFPAVSSGRWGLGLGAPDDVCYFGDGAHLALANQAEDSVAIVGADEATGALGRCEILLRDAGTALNFPHGCHVSPDSRYLAVANYGSDTVTVYSVSRCS